MIFSIKKSQLCDLVQGGQVCGMLTDEAAKETGLPLGMVLFAGGSDKSCETLGAGVIDTSLAAISLGTACTIETTTAKYVEPVTFLPAYPNILPGLYNMDFQIYRGFWMINWFLKEFGAYNIDDLVTTDVTPQEYNAKIPTIPAGCQGLMLQPYWGSPLEHPEVKGSIVGFSDYTTKAHFYKAIVEGIGYELRLAKEAFEKRLKTQFKAIRISGGGARSDEICQVYADLFGLPVERVQTVETSSLGAAIGGFLSLGVYKTPEEAVAKMVRVTKTFQPNPENTKVYDELFNGVYKDLYPSLKKTLRNLYNFAAAN